MPMRKTFPTIAVLGVVTGRVLVEGGMAGIHEVMNHLYPGIMTVGVAAMRDTAAKEIQRQMAVRGVDLPPYTDPWSDYAKAAVEQLGPTLDIDGPHEVSNQHIADAFAVLGKKENDRA